MNIRAIFFTAIALLSFLCGGEGQDYADYARGAGKAKKKNNSGALLVAAMSSILGGFVGSWLTGGRMKKKNDKDRKDLLQYMQMQEEVYKQRERQWQQEYRKLYKIYEELEKESVERDYEEFKAPDTNNDDMISRAEFNTYVRKYLSSFPELSEKDFPQFDEFDLDGDGIVSFDEWQQFLVQQKMQEAKKKEQGQKGNDNSAYAELLNALYEQSAQSDSFNTLNRQIDSQSRGRGRGRV